MASSIRPLPLWCVPHPEESLLGHLLRLAQRLRYPTAAPILQKAGVGNFIESHPFDWDAVQKIAATVPTQKDQIESLAYADDAHACQFRGHPLHRDLITITRRRVCPMCLHDDGGQPFHRAIWDLTLLAVCPEHGRGLLRECTRCKSKLTWRTSAVFRCQCGADLRQQSPGAVCTDMAGTNEMVAVLTSDPGKLDGLAGQLGASEWLRLVVLLGRTEHGAGQGPKAIKFSKLDAAVVPAVLSSGMRACADWPKSFFGLLDVLRSNEGARSGRFGLAKAFGGLPTTLRAQGGAPHIDLIQAAFDQYVASIPSFSTKRRAIHEIRAEGPQVEKFLTLMQVARRLRVAPGKFSEFAYGHGFVRDGEGGSGAPILFSETVVRELEEQLADLIEQKEACKLLGICRGAFSRLHAAGCLPQPSGVTAAALRLRPLWSRAAILAWRDAVCVVGTPPAGELIDLTEASRQVSAVEKGAATVLQALLDGTLKVAAIEGEVPGLAALRFNKSDVAHLRRCLKPATYSAVEAASLLKVSQRAVYQWMRSGFMRSTVSQSRSDLGFRVSPTDLAEFIAEYITPDELRRLGLGQRPGLALAKLGVPAVSGPDVDGARQFLFRRADVEEFMTRHHPTTAA